MQSKGFIHDQTDKAPLCRWNYHGTIVDVMPLNDNILGFTNEWYSQALKYPTTHNIDATVKVKILSVPYFCATKLSALISRGMVDLRTSKDWEDIAFVLNNRSSVIQDIIAGDSEVVQYICHTFSHPLSIDIIEEAILSVLD